MDNHCDDEKLIKRIYGKYHQLIHIKKQKLHLKEEKCKKTIVGTIGLYILSMNHLIKKIRKSSICH